MNTTLTADESWRAGATKVAAAAAQPNQDVEKAFLDQAYMTIQNKARPFMKDPYRVGFEIIEKNDENTKMVGIFVFRVGKKLFYVPTFFTNGSIKGTDMVYRTEEKQFVPLTPEWSEYLIAMNESAEGVPVSQTERTKTRDQMNLLRVVEPPQVYRNLRKYASDGSEQSNAFGLDDTEWSDYETFKGQLTKVAEFIPAEDFDGRGRAILRQFITEFGGFNAIQKIANTTQGDFEFGCALMTASDPEVFAPQLKPIKEASAAKTTEPLIVFHAVPLKNASVKSASAKQMSDGFVIEDFRKLAAETDVVFEDSDQAMQTITDPGVYNVLMADGEFRKCIVALTEDLSCSNDPEISCDHGIDGADRIRQSRTIVAVDDWTGHKIWDINKNEPIYGEMVGRIEDQDFLIPTTEAKAGQAYRVYNEKLNAISRPFYVNEVYDDEVSGLKALRVSYYNASYPERNPILLNPDYDDLDYRDCILGNCCKLLPAFVEKVDSDDGEPLEMDRRVPVGHRDAVNRFIFTNGMAKGAAHVDHEPHGTTFKLRTQRTNQQWTDNLNKAAATVRLMVDCNVSQGLAEDILKQASEVGTFRFIYNTDDCPLDPETKRLEKRGYSVKFNDWPDFYERVNDEFGVLEQPFSQYIAQTDFERPVIDRHRVGDVLMQETGDVLNTGTPMDLYELSQSRGVDNLFHHGVLGELLKTYDASSVIQSYTGDLQQGLDRLGRILFLFYWKPEDFAAAYGMDDHTTIEQQLLSNFKNLGAMVLELLQTAKSDNMQGFQSS